MAYALGVTLFAVGILVSIALHEYGHAGTARAFGMKVTRYFIGFGPTLFSFRRKETEYGLKAIPAGAFVKIVGMTPHDDDVRPEDEHRAMWRYPVWKRSIVLGAGSLVHFLLGFLILWGIYAIAPLPTEPLPAAATVADCVALEWEVDESGRLVECDPEQDPPSGAKVAGLQPGDTILAVDAVAVTGWEQLTELLRDAGGRTVTLTLERDGRELTTNAPLQLAERPREDLDPRTPVTEITDADLEQVGVLGITPDYEMVRHGPVAGAGLAVEGTGQIFRGIGQALVRLPEKVPELWQAIFGGERGEDTPVSVIGASRIGGELWDRGEVVMFLSLLAVLNFFIGIFNLLPLLPLDGGHLAIAWFEKARSWLYARLGRPDPGRVDYYKLMPLTYVVIVIMAGFFLLTITADIVNPIRLL